MSTLRDVASYTIVAYGFSWIFWLPQVLYYMGIQILPTFYVWIVGFVAPFGPLVGAFLVTYIKQGRQEILRLARRGTNRQFRKIWLLPLILFYPLWAASAILLGVYVEGTPVSLPWTANPLLLIFNPSNPVYSLVYLFIFTGVAEEFGWRGYCLDRIQKHYNASVSSILIGLLWAFWHLPLFFIPGSPQQAATIGPFLAQVVFYSFLYTWFHNNMNGSVLAAIVFHTMADFTLLVLLPVSYLFGPESFTMPFLYITGGILLAVILIVFGPARLVREQPNKQSAGPT